MSLAALASYTQASSGAISCKKNTTLATYLRYLATDEPQAHSDVLGGMKLTTSKARWRRIEHFGSAVFQLSWVDFGILASFFL
jgi:hypothetical protein